MKANYENRNRHYLTRRMPLIVRVDGKAFHTYTRGMPAFCSEFMDAMTYAARGVSEEMQGFKAAYIQSDEASFFLTDYDTLQTDAWFGYSQSKIESVSASVMTAMFNFRRRVDGGGGWGYFDSRAFSIPREEVANYFLWRAKDWERNSVAMYCQQHFSANQLLGKGKADQHEMLHVVGKNWVKDLDDRSRNGTWIFADGDDRTDILPRYDDIAEVLNPRIYCDLQKELEVVEE